MEEIPISQQQGRLVEQPHHEIWVRGGDKVSHIADQIYRNLIVDKQESVDLASIGATALNQGVKGIAEMRARVRGFGMDVVAAPWFSVIEDEFDRERTRMMLRVFLVELPAKAG